MPVSIRFFLNSENINFDHEEIGISNIEPGQEFEVQENQKSGPNIITRGDAWKLLTITFRNAYPTIGAALGTKDKFEKIINSEQKFTIYYEYLYETTTNSDFILFPSGDTKYKEEFVYGQPIANNTFTASFLEVPNA